jgi:hypothetical protein
MHGTMGSVRLLGQPNEQGLTEVYFRPPKAYMETPSLLKLLERRLSGEAIAEPALR